MKKDNIINYLKMAFPESTNNLAREAIVDNNFNQHHESMELYAGKTWIEIEECELYYSEDAVRSITKLAFSYYIAAYLKLFIENYHSAGALVDTVIDMLTPPLRNGAPSATWIEKNIKHFNFEKRKGVAMTLLYLSEEYSDQNAENALKIYWRKYLNEPLQLEDNTVEDSGN